MVDCGLSISGVTGPIKARVCKEAWVLFGDRYAIIGAAFEVVMEVF